MSDIAELIVLGGGPAGMAAATAAADRGVDTVIIDENAAPGGQVYRSMPASFRIADREALGPDHAIGDRLRSALESSGARTAFGHRVWSAAHTEGGFRMEAVWSGGRAEWNAGRLVAAPGTTERLLPFPGWTTPGVIGLAGATILLKAQRMLPGKAVVVAGAGPLVMAVAASINKGGGKVAAVADLASPGEWLAAMPRMTGRADLLVRGLGWMRAIRAAGVPVLFRHAVRAAEGAGALEAVTLGPVDREGHPKEGQLRRFGCDALAIGYGLVPSTEVSRLMGAEHRFDALRGGWAPVRDVEGATSVPGFHVAGDAGGIGGAAVAEVAGRLAGLAVARDLGRIDAAGHQQEAGPLRAALAKADRFGATMARMMRPRPGLLDICTPDTVVCRCEDVTRAEVEQVIAAGALEFNQLKQWSRCGMGPCQGRMCGEATAMLIAKHVGGREKAGLNRARVPIRPVPLDQLAGTFAYDDSFWESDAAKLSLNVLPDENQVSR
ncbi:MAG: NAD(P)/FAD-dependent oxidoreductase [Acetobacterales bacterium]